MKVSLCKLYRNITTQQSISLGEGKGEGGSLQRYGTPNIDPQVVGFLYEDPKKAPLFS